MRFRFLLVPFAVILAAMSSQGDDRESFAVMTAVLDSLYHSDGDRASVIVLGDSLFEREGGVAYGGKLLVPYRSSIDPATIRDFEAKTARSVPFPRAFTYKRLVLHEMEDWQALEERGRQIEKTKPKDDRINSPFWMAFSEKYPHAWGVGTLSQVGFNAQKTEALIFVRHQCGGNCGSSEAIYLKKVRGRWRIIERIAGLSWEGVGLGSLRYIGPGVHRLVIMRKQQDSTRRAIADSIRADAAPRIIRGTIRNRQTGLPIGHAQIFVRAHSQLQGDSVRREVADSRGRYVIRNPMIGGTMLEVQCPGSGHRPGATLDAPSFYVFPQIDTVINMGPPNIEPCWSTRRVQPVMSGELAAQEYRTSQFPSSMDVTLYDALVRELHLGDSAVLSAETRPWCRIFHQCPTVHVAHLERIGLLDSSTFENFKAIASDSVRLNPVAMERLGIPLLSVGERIYLMQEAKRGGMFADAIDERGFWTGLRTNHPGAKRILSFTRTGYNLGKNQAIVSYHIQLPEDEIDETLLLHNKEGQWRIVRRHLEAETITGELVDGKCLPAEPGARPTDEQLANIFGLFDFTLVASATNNRVTTRRVTIKEGSVHFDKDSGAGEIDFGGSLLIRGVSPNHLFGEWVEHFGGHGIPIGRDGKAIPYPAGHFCATRIEQ